MIHNGAQPTRIDHRDYDLVKSFGLTTVPDFPAELNLDNGLWNPDQNAMALPFGCTGFTQADLCADEDGVIYDPKDVYVNTPPYDDGGRDIRAALDTVRKRGVRKYLSLDAPGNKRTAYFNIRAKPPLDWFDCFRLSLLSTKDEKRSISIGTPYFPEFVGTADGILPMPRDFNVARASWHNFKICGFTTKNGQVYLVGKPWTGQYTYISRPLINQLMNISGTAAFTTSKIAPGQIQTIDLNFIQWFVSLIRVVLHL